MNEAYKMGKNCSFIVEAAKRKKMDLLWDIFTTFFDPTIEEKNGR
jgi:hypothetical protein